MARNGLIFAIQLGPVVWWPVAEAQAGRQESGRFLPPSLGLRTGAWCVGPGVEGMVLGRRSREDRRCKYAAVANGTYCSRWDLAPQGAAHLSQR